MQHRLAIVAPLGESELDLSSLWVRELAPLLAKEFEVEIFTGDGDLLSEIVPRPSHFLRLFERERVAPFSAVLTFLEDSPRSLFVRFGMVGTACLTIAIDATVERMFSVSPWEFLDQAKYPLLTQALEPALAVGVTTAHASGQVSRLMPRKRLFGTAHPVSPLSEEERRVRAGRTGREDFRVAYSGRYFVEDRARMMLDAAFSLALNGHPVHLDWVCAAANAKGIGDFQSVTAETRGVDATQLVTVRPIETFRAERLALCEADAFVYMRGDVLRSPPSALYHALAAGVPTIALDFGPASELPDGVVIKIPAGRGEEEGLKRALLELERSGEIREQMSAAGRAYMEEIHAPSAVFADLAAMIRHTADQRSAHIERSRVNIENLERSLWA